MARAIPLLQRNEAGTNKPPAKRGGGSNYTYDGPRCHWL